MNECVGDEGVNFRGLSENTGWGDLGWEVGGGEGRAVCSCFSCLFLFFFLLDGFFPGWALEC